MCLKSSTGPSGIAKAHNVHQVMPERWLKHWIRSMFTFNNPLK